MRRFVLTVAVLVLGLATFVAGPSTVFAHADYDRSEPNKDEVVPEPPARVDVWFTQELFKQEGRNFVRVFDESDVQVTEGDGVVDDDDRTHMYAELPTDLQPGRYVVRWKTTSDEDGDTDEGAFCFYIGVEPTEQQEAECAELAGDDEATPTPLPTEPEQTTEPAETAEGTPPDAGEENGDDDDGGVPAVAVIIGAIAGVVVLGGVAGGAVIWLRRSLG